MGVSVTASADYADLMQSLRPRGPAWVPGDGLDLASADEMTRIHNRAVQLVEEADPRTSAELFADWERVAGLPDVCVGAEQSTGQRRAALLARLSALGGQTPGYFVNVAAELGYSITIDTFNVHDVNDDVNAEINGPLWQFAWRVNAALASVFELTVADTVADPLASWGNEALECAINRLKPSHTHALFAYS